MLHNSLIDEEIKKIINLEFFTQGKYPHNYLTFNRVPFFFFKLNDLFLNNDYPIEEKSEIIKTIFSSWRKRLRKYKSYYLTGYKFYFYYSHGFYISVAPSNHNFNLDIPGIPVFYSKINEVIKKGLEIRKVEKQANQNSFDYKYILNIIEINKGSISHQTANKLGISKSNLRILIANNYLAPFVDNIRKKYKRRPLDLKYKEPNLEDYKIYIYQKTLPKIY